MYRKRRFAKMYDKYADDIFRYLYVRVRDVQTAEDLTADTFTRAWNNIDSFDFSQPRPWLYKIARNLLTDFWRRKKPLTVEEFEEPVSESNIAEELDKQLDREKVQAAIGRLPEQMREVVTMRFILGYSVRQASQSLEISESNVRIIQYRALKKMKGYLS